MESAERIVAEVAAYGGRVTKRQLDRFSHARLIGPKQQCHVPGRSGSETYYPDGTLEQVLVIGRICGWRKCRMTQIGWQLWWNGYQVDEKYWKEYLRRRATWYDKALPIIEKAIYRGRSREISNGGFDAMGKLRRVRTRQSLFLKLRRRIISKNWETAIRVPIDIATGRYRGMTENHDPAELKIDKEILDSALGLRRARRDVLDGAGPWLDGDIDSPLIELSRNLAASKLIDTLSAPNIELEKCRDEVRSIFEIFMCSSGPLEYAFGRNAFGFRAIAQIAKHAGPDLQALFILMWPTLKKSQGAPEKIDELLSVAPEARSLRAAYQALEHSRQINPRLATILTPRRLKAALMNKDNMRALITELEYNNSDRH